MSAQMETLLLLLLLIVVGSCNVDGDGVVDDDDLRVWHPCQPPSPALDNIQVTVIVWSLRGNIIRTVPCWAV